MRAVRVHEHGGPDVLRLDEVDPPRPAAGEALVKIACSGVNFLDIQYRTGRGPAAPLPLIPGSAAAGVVEDGQAHRAVALREHGLDRLG